MCNIMIVISVCFLISVIPITSLMIYSQFSRPTTSKWVFYSSAFSLKCCHMRSLCLFLHFNIVEKHLTFFICMFMFSSSPGMFMVPLQKKNQIGLKSSLPYKTYKHCSLLFNVHHFSFNLQMDGSQLPFLLPELLDQPDHHQLKIQMF